jgi:hypothetical protein
MCFKLEAPMITASPCSLRWSLSSGFVVFRDKEDLTASDNYDDLSTLMPPNPRSEVNLLSTTDLQGHTSGKVRSNFFAASVMTSIALKY